MQQFERFIRIKEGRNVNFRTQPVVGNNVIDVAKSGEVFQTFNIFEGTTWCVARRELTGQIGYITTLSTYVEDFVPDWLAKVERVVNYGETFLGKPYVFGSNRTNDTSFDCSDFVQWIYDEELGISIPWDSRKQSVFGTEVSTGYDSLRTGDLIFFDTNKDGIVNHVAMYVFPHKILHTYNRTCNIYNRDMVKVKDDCGGVTYSRYEDGTSWRNNTTGARRIVTG